jgi:hypothetical protein
MATGAIATVCVDFVASNPAGSYTALGTLPDGVVPAETALGSYNAALAFRGSASGGQSGMITVNTETRGVTIWTSTADKYYTGSVTFPVR